MISKKLLVRMIGGNQKIRWGEVTVNKVFFGLNGEITNIYIY